VGSSIRRTSGRPSSTRHGDAHLPAARQCAHVAIDALVVKTQPVQHLACLTLERITSEMLVLLLDFAEPLEHPLHLVRSRGIRHRLVERFELVMQIADAAASGDRFIEHRSSRHLLDVLPEVADGELLRH
jgi:hypothetical protein